MHNCKCLVSARPLALAVAGWLLAAGGVFAASLQVTHPAANAVVRGTVPLAVQVVGMPGVASVEFLINGRLLESGRIAEPPYVLEWNSAAVWNGEMHLTAAARDSSGQILAASAPVPFRVANGAAAARHLSPVPPGPVSGRINWTIQMSDTEPIEAVMFFVDGQEMDIVFGDRERATISLDTTRFADGSHELFAGVHSLAVPKRAVAMTQARVTFNNGRAVRAVLPRYRELFLVPGETAALAPSLLYTNGDRQPAAGVRYESLNPAVAAVDADGVVRAIAAGVTTVVAEAQGRRAEVAVVIGDRPGVPHFSRDGRLLESYDPRSSLFVRTLFTLDHNELAQTPGLAAQLQAAGINTLTSGFWALPQDIGYPKDYEEWRQRWDPMWDRVESIAREHNLSLLLVGDNVARGPRELHTTLTAPWGLPGLRHAFTRMRDSGRVVSVEMVDEASGLWGDVAVPKDGRWLKGEPPIPNNAFLQLMNVIRSVPDATPVTWPVLWLSSPDAVRNWMGDPVLSDYTSMFWDKLAWRSAYPWGMSLPQLRESMEHVTVKRRHVIQRNRPLLLQMSVAGPFYTKLGPGTRYTPGQDRLQEASHTPVSVAAQALYAMAVGAAGVRVYSYDSSIWKRNRAFNGIEIRNLQTGADPSSVGTERWRAMAAAFQLVDRIEPYLLQSRLPSPELGPEFVTGARRGPRSALLIAVNMTEAPAVARPDLDPYIVPGATTIIRYRLQGSRLAVETIPLAVTDEVTLLPGEGAVWLAVSPKRTSSGRLADEGAPRSPHTKRRSFGGSSRSNDRKR